jgi:hypothetical protein
MITGPLPKFHGTRDNLVSAESVLILTTFGKNEGSAEQAIRDRR